jgi:hypothetical protein
MTLNNNSHFGPLVLIAILLSRLSQPCSTSVAVGIAARAKASIMASATPFFFCTTQKHLAVKRSKYFNSLCHYPSNALYKFILNYNMLYHSYNYLIFFLFLQGIEIKGIYKRLKCKVVSLYPADKSDRASAHRPLATACLLRQWQCLQRG